VEKVAKKYQGNVSASFDIIRSLLFMKCLTLGVGFNGICFRLLERKCLNCSYGRPRESPYAIKPLPVGVPRPMCLCGDLCKVDISEDEETYRQRYWMCPNFAWEPTEQQRRSDFIVRKFYSALLIFVI
jgi:hypothetical protein